MATVSYFTSFMQPIEWLDLTKLRFLRKSKRNRQQETTLGGLDLIEKFKAVNEPRSRNAEPS
jgi:hypothetical protein